MHTLTLTPRSQDTGIGWSLSGAAGNGNGEPACGVRGAARALHSAHMGPPPRPASCGAGRAGVPIPFPLKHSGSSSKDSCWGLPPGNTPRRRPPSTRVCSSGAAHGREHQLRPGARPRRGGPCPRSRRGPQRAAPGGHVRYPNSGAPKRGHPLPRPAKHRHGSRFPGRPCCHGSGGERSRRAGRGAWDGPRPGTGNTGSLATDGGTPWGAGRGSGLFPGLPRRLEDRPT